MHDDDSQGVTVSNESAKKRTWRSLMSGRPKIVYPLLAIVLIAIIAAIAVNYFQDDNEPSEKRRTEIEQKVNQAVTGSIENPDYDAASQELLRQLEKTGDKKKQADIYNQLSSIAVQQGNHEKVIEYETKASRLDPSRADSLARIIADSHRELGNKEEALKYYRQALEYYTSRPENYSGRAYYINDINAKIAEMEQ